MELPSAGSASSAGLVRQALLPLHSEEKPPGSRILAETEEVKLGVAFPGRKPAYGDAGRVAPIVEGVRGHSQLLPGARRSPNQETASLPVIYRRQRRFVVVRALLCYLGKWVYGRERREGCSATRSSVRTAEGWRLAPQRVLSCRGGGSGRVKVTYDHHLSWSS